MASREAEIVSKDIAQGDVLNAFLREALQITRLDIRENFLTKSSPDGVPWTPLKHPRVRDGSTGPPLQDTKALYRSAIQQGAPGHVEQLNESGFIIGTNHPLAHVHNDGMTIKAKKKYMTLPLTKEAQKAGGASNFPRKLFFLKTKSGNKFLAETKGKKQKLVLQYLLKTFVTIPAREFIGVGDRLFKKIEDAYVRMVVTKHHGTSN